MREYFPELVGNGRLCARIGEELTQGEAVPCLSAGRSAGKREAYLCLAVGGGTGVRDAG